jgi:2-furoyl-CoA dehydrogenase FAD binding subunit
VVATSPDAGNRTMKPKSFAYVRARDLDEALDSLSSHGEDARILAGGQSLVAMMNFRLVQPKALIDISGIGALDYIRIDGGCIEIGAATTQARLMAWPDLARTAPLLAAALPHIGHYQTRSRGTVCGSIAHSDPSSELPLCLATLSGSVVLRSRGGMRRLSAADFQIGMLSTARLADEIVSAVRFPLWPDKAGCAFREMARRRGDFAICAVAATISAGKVRLGVGGVADRPTVHEWPELPDSAIDDALNEMAWDMAGSDDIHATASYRRQLIRRLGRQAILEARQCQN